jgi:hypothetical protein
MYQLQKFIIQKGWIGILAVLLFTSCQKDHFIGGSLANEHSELSTYDYLKTNPLFDTLVLLIDKAGLKETINSHITFVAPTDYGIKRFLDSRTKELQREQNDENIKYTLDSLKAPELRDSLMAYMFDADIERKDMGNDKLVFKNKVGEQFAFRLILMVDGNLSAGYSVMNISKVVNGVDPVPLPSNFPEDDIDPDYVLQTTGILTTTGVLHVLSNAHTFYWK